MERLAFYFKNAALSLLRERRRAIFAIFTVVVGVAAIVGLQLTADILESSLTSNVRTLLRGDLAVSKGSEAGGGFARGEIAAVQALEDEGLIEGFTVRGTPSDFVDFTKFKLTVVGRTDKDAVTAFYAPTFLELDVFPYYGEVSSKGQGLWDMIQDEFDVDELEIQTVGRDEYLMDARVSIDQLDELLGIVVEADGFDTVGGFVYDRLGRIPSLGDLVVHDGLRIEVVSTVGRRLKKLRVSRS